MWGIAPGLPSLISRNSRGPDLQSGRAMACGTGFQSCEIRIRTGLESCATDSELVRSYCHFPDVPSARVLPCSSIYLNTQPSCPKLGKKSFFPFASQLNVFDSALSNSVPASNWSGLNVSRILSTSRSTSFLCLSLAGEDHSGAGMVPGLRNNRSWNVRISSGDNSTYFFLHVSGWSKVVMAQT